jgi:hypothetical protein
MIELFLPFPPSANRLWSRTKTGARLSDGYSKWLRDAGLLANAQIGAVSDDSYCEMISARWLTSGEGIVVRVSAAGME